MEILKFSLSKLVNVQHFLFVNPSNNNLVISSFLIIILLEFPSISRLLYLPDTFETLKVHI